MLLLTCLLFPELINEVELTEPKETALRRVGSVVRVCNLKHLKLRLETSFRWQKLFCRTQKSKNTVKEKDSPRHVPKVYSPQALVSRYPLPESSLFSQISFVNFTRFQDQDDDLDWAELLYLLICWLELAQLSRHPVMGVWRWIRNHRMQVITSGGRIC